MTKNKDPKKSKAYKSLSPEAKLMYEFCLYKGAGDKGFELDYDEFLAWLYKQEHPAIGASL